MNKKLIVALMVLCVFSIIALIATPFDYTPFESAVTDLVDDLVPVVTAVLGAVLALAGAILIVRVGFRWIRGFIS